MSFVEQVVMRSFLDAGHSFILYCLEDVGALPDGVEVRDPRPIFAPPFEVGPGLRHNNAVYTDLFRLFMIRDTGAIWADLDAYCLRPFRLPTEYVFGIENVKGEERVATGVLGCPQSSPALALSIDIASEPCPIPPFFTQRKQSQLRQRRDTGETFGFQDLTWGASGPRLIDYCLRETGEVSHAQPKNVFYPGPRAFRQPLLRPDTPIEVIEQPETLSVHVFGKTKQFLVNDYGGKLPVGCYLDVICRRHGVDPADFPVPQ